MACGCSCRRTPRAPWDSGLQISPTSRATDPGAAGTGSGRSAELGKSGGGADGDTGGGQGEAGSEGAREKEQHGSGSDEQGDRASGKASPARGGGSAPATAAMGENEASGIGDTSGAGGSTEPRPSAGIFPGRPAVTELGATEAMRTADANMTAAQLACERGRFVEAYDLAARAYELVQPHAAGNPECEKMAGVAMNMLRELAKELPKLPPSRPHTTTFFE